MGGAEDIGAVAFRPQPGGGGLGRGGLMAEGLEQPTHAGILQRRAEEHRRDEAVAHLLDQVAEDHRRLGIHLAQQLFQEGVVVAGELFQHVEAGVGLGLGEVAGDVDLLELLALAVDEGALQGEVDEAGDLVVLEDGQLAGDQRHAGGRLQGVEQLADVAVGLVDLVDEDGARHAQLVELGQQGPQQHRLVRIGVGDHQGHVGGGDGEVGFRLELHRPGAVEQGEALAHVVEGGHVQLDRLMACAGFGAGVAGGAAGLDGALPVDGAGGEQQGLHQARLARADRSHQRDGARESS